MNRPRDSKQEARLELIAGLRAVADFYESRPAAYDDGMPLSLNMYVGGRRACRALIAMAAAFGECEISQSEGLVAVQKKFSPRVKLELFSKSSF